MKFNKSLGNILLILFSFLIGFSIVEIIARIEGSYKRELNIVNSINKAPKIRNSLLEISNNLKIDENIINIYAIGDSFTHGVLQDKNSSWIPKLNRLINDQQSTTFRIYNLGISGTNIIEQCKVFREIKEIDKNPIFIHQLFVNDFYGKEWEKFDSFKKYNGKKEGKVFRKFPLHFMHYIYKAIKKSSLKNNNFLNYTLQFAEEDKKHWGKIVDIYSECYLSNSLDNKNTFTFLYPSLTWGGKSGWSQNEENYPYQEFDDNIIKKLNNVNIIIFDLLTEMRKKIPIAQLHWLSKDLPDAHPDNYANSIAAESIFKMMKDSNFLKN